MGSLPNLLCFQVPGVHTGEIFAKLEVYMWLGVTKYAKNCLVELPEEFRYLSESGQEIAQLSAYSPPSRLRRDGECRCHFPWLNRQQESSEVLPRDWCPRSRA